MKPIAIIGAGNGGCAMAADMTLRGFDVHLCEVYHPQRIDELQERGSIELAGAAGEGLATPKLMTSNLAEAIHEAEIIIWTIPATGHQFHVNKIARHIKSGQTLILMPGAVGGGLFVANMLKKLGLIGVEVGETCTLPYGCRLTSPVRVEVYDVAKDVLFAMLNDTKTEEVLNRLKPLLPHLMKGKTVLDTSLNYMNLLLHPVGMVMNAGWIEHRKGDFAYYYDGISPAVANVLQALDEERLNIIRAFDLVPIRFEEWFFRRGKTQKKDSVYNAIHFSVPNRNFRAPENLKHRFVEEDVPFALVPLSHFGKMAGVKTPVLDALILLSSAMLKEDFQKIGHDLEKMGIAGISKDKLLSRLSKG